MLGAEHSKRNIMNIYENWIELEIMWYNGDATLLISGSKVSELHFQHQF